MFQIFKHYTKKQWDKYPVELNASVLARLPFRLTNDDRYFDDPYEGLPKDGYTRLFENMVLKDKNVDVRLKMDYFALKDKLPKHKLLVFTGPIDAYFASKGMKKLEYRSIYFEVRTFLRVLKVNFSEECLNYIVLVEFREQI